MLARFTYGFVWPFDKKTTPSFELIVGSVVCVFHLVSLLSDEVPWFLLVILSVAMFSINTNKKASSFPS